MPTTCFMTSPTDMYRLTVRRHEKLRYNGDELIKSACPSPPYGWGHDASVMVAEAQYGTPQWSEVVSEYVLEKDRDDLKDGHGWSTGTGVLADQAWIDAHRAKFPATCVCGYAFTDDDEWSIDLNDVWKRDDTGELIGVQPHKFPPGAMYFAPWADHMFTPQLEHVLCVILPNGHGWLIDSQASNCGMKDDTRMERHHCWVLHGTPPLVSADKNGPTCVAGGGSILSGDYHGFLTGGVLTP